MGLATVDSLSLSLCAIGYTGLHKARFNKNLAGPTHTKTNNTALIDRYRYLCTHYTVFVCELNSIYRAILVYVSPGIRVKNIYGS